MCQGFKGGALKPLNLNRETLENPPQICRRLWHTQAGQGVPHHSKPLPAISQLTQPTGGQLCRQGGSKGVLGRTRQAGRLAPRARRTPGPGRGERV